MGARVRSAGRPPVNFHAAVSQKLSHAYSRHIRERRRISLYPSSPFRHSADQPNSPGILRRNSPASSASHCRLVWLERRTQTKWNSSWTAIRHNSRGRERSSDSKIISRFRTNVAACTGWPRFAPNNSFPWEIDKSATKQTRIRLPSNTGNPRTLCRAASNSRASLAPAHHLAAAPPACRVSLRSPFATISTVH